MFWVTDSEKVIEDHPARPSTMTLEKWKEMKDQMEYSNDRTWPYHGMSPYAIMGRGSVLNKFWRDHISDKYGLGGDTAPYVRRPSQQCRRPPSPMRWRRRKRSGIVPRRVNVYFHKGCSVRRTRKRPTLGLATKTRYYHGRRKLGD